MVDKRIFKIRYVILEIILIPGILCISSNYRIAYSNINKADLYKYYSNNDQFRSQIIKFVRRVIENSYDNQLIQSPQELKITGNWELDIEIYYKGELKGRGNGKDKLLSSALQKAVKSILVDKRCQNLSKADIENARFLITLYLANKQFFSFIEYKGKGKELIDDLVAIRNLDKKLIQQKIEQGEKYLLKVIDKDRGGVHKYYYVLNDSFENRLHTIYTSSVIYTLLKIYNFQKDELLLKQILNCSEFVLSMQNKKEGTKGYGAFYYSYYLDKEKRENKFVVGTTSKTIFTLLELYKLTKDNKYLKSAKLGANWLITMQNPNGSMKPYIRYRDGKWYHGKRESLLYDGQVLSAFSRIYKITEEKKYYNAAENIAQRLIKKVEKEGCYLDDDYRKKNPISNSWVIMSLLDFYKINQDRYCEKLIFKCSVELLKRQIKNIKDIRRYGRWNGAYSTSGNGWISEVIVGIYEFCKEQGRNDYDEYKNAIIKVTRWLIQNTYSEENTFFLKNPEKAIGGLFWNYKNKYVRTDSVCHAVNAYIGIIGDLEDGLLLSIPEKSLEIILE